jgi:hypothetical protein
MAKLKQVILAGAAAAALACIPIAPAEAGIHGGHFHPWLLGHGVVGAVLGLATLPLAIASSVIESAGSQGADGPRAAYYPPAPAYYAAPQAVYAPRAYYAPRPYYAQRPYYAPHANYYAPRPNYYGGNGGGRGAYRPGGYGGARGYPQR